MLDSAESDTILPGLEDVDGISLEPAFEDDADFHKGALPQSARAVPLLFL